MKLPSHIPWSNKASCEFNPRMICTWETELLISERLLTLLSLDVLQHPTVSDVCQHLHKNIKPHRNVVIIYTLFYYIPHTRHSKKSINCQRYKQQCYALAQNRTGPKLSVFSKSHVLDMRDMH